MVELGVSSGWSSPYIARLRENRDVPFTITMDESSWVASLLNLGRLMGALLGAMSVNFNGSKLTMLLNVLPISLGWILTVMAKDAIWLYFARFCGGVGLGMTYSSFPLYLGEIALPEIRGSLVSFASWGGTFGIMLGNVVGSYLDLKLSAEIYLIPCLALIILFLWLPESPHHLIKSENYFNTLFYS